MLHELASAARARNHTTHTPSIKGFTVHVVDRNEQFKSEIIISAFHIFIGRQKARNRVVATLASCYKMSERISRKGSTLPDPRA